MKRSILSALFIGSAAALLFRRSRQNRSIIDQMVESIQRDAPRWMRNMKLSAAMAGIVSRTMGSKMIRRFGR
ncbi:hypothetical protein ACFQ49_12335 [Kroppenstedtia eburnea]|uniref:Uncharacterized protein n=1 Tax=Kroppenstedtia eburnea TaxID=714067 RepID=A0A1N7KMJ4_9BACL|nr:hypothetical protein [Kroppenstedtia eburnea]EGK12276.1 hypothetical protein HMPREF9374_1596 [Desmospora sp. 8437]QKI82902.1 hypothetical protein GXN75_13365 [Kroppenstedtia eburnea]SIS62813.1 hypothetical protein SAMN05421790_103163 [Kroppenstedtia eburnea]